MISIFNRGEGAIRLCLLVENPHADPGIQVHCRLIEAYCWECAIPVIKVRNIQYMVCHFRLKRKYGLMHQSEILASSCLFSKLGPDR